MYRILVKQNGTPYGFLCWVKGILGPVNGASESDAAPREREDAESKADFFRGWSIRNGPRNLTYHVEEV